MSSAMRVAMPANVYEENSVVIVSMPMPGLEPEDIAIAIEGTRVMLQGVRRGDDQEAVAHGRVYRVREWTVGPYERTVDVGVPVDGAKANATMGNGVVMVILPKAERASEGRVELTKVGQARGMHVGHVGRGVLEPPPGRVRAKGGPQ